MKWYGVAMCVTGIVVGMYADCSAENETGNTTGPATTHQGLPEAKEVFRFEGEVARVVTMVEFDGKAIRTDVNPRFAVVVRKIRKLAGDGPTVKDDTLVFAIHSPTNTFVTDDPVDKTFEFRMVRYGNAKTDLQRIEAREVIPSAGTSTAPRK